MKKIFFAVCLVVALFAAWYMYTDGTMSLEAARRKIGKEAQEAVVQNASPEDVAALAMKAINMTQGEHGAELWRLKAEWGNVRRKDNIMEIGKPNFTYYMAPDHIPLNVTSEKGEVDQEEQKVRFVGSVVATYQDRVVKAPMMVYSGKKRKLVCPEGAKMTGAKNMAGSANRAVWDLNTKILNGFGEVDMTFENSAIPAPEGSGEQQNVPANGGPQG
jgi:hypothetical protein